MDPALIVFIIAILIVATVAWKEFGGAQDLKRLRHRLRRDEPTIERGRSPHEALRLPTRRMPAIRRWGCRDSVWSGRATAGRRATARSLSAKFGGQAAGWTSAPPARPVFTVRAWPFARHAGRRRDAPPNGRARLRRGGSPVEARRRSRARRARGRVRQAGHPV